MTSLCFPKIPPAEVSTQKRLIQWRCGGAIDKKMFDLKEVLGEECDTPSPIIILFIAGNTHR